MSYILEKSVPWKAKARVAVSPELPPMSTYTGRRRRRRRKKMSDARCKRALADLHSLSFAGSSCDFLTRRRRLEEKSCSALTRLCSKARIVGCHMVKVDFGSPTKNCLTPSATISTSPPSLLTVVSGVLSADDGDGLVSLCLKEM